MKLKAEYFKFTKLTVREEGKVTSPFSLVIRCRTIWKKRENSEQNVEEST